MHQLAVRKNVATTNRGHRSRNRKGNAIIELAFSMFLLFLVVFGSVEACNAIYLQQFITETSYQGAIAGIKPDATTSDVEGTVNEFLEARGITDAQVLVKGVGTNANFDDVLPGEQFFVRVTVPAGTNLDGPLIAQYQDFSAESICTRQ